MRRFELSRGRNFENEKLILLVDTPKSIVRLIKENVTINSVNIGGMHFKPGKKQIAPFIFVDDDDIENFRILHLQGIRLEGRDVPTCAAIYIAKVLSFDKEDDSGE